MSPETQAALITVALTAAAALFGYLFREYRDRLRPMVAIIAVGGDFRVNPDRVDIPQELVSKIKPTFYIRTLDPIDTLAEVYAAWDAADDLIQFGDECIQDLEKLVAAAKSHAKDQFTSSFAKFIGNTYFDRWLTRLLATDRLVPAPADPALPVQISTHLADDHDGCIWFDFGAESTFLGERLHKFQIVKQRCQRFVAILERLQFEDLATLFQTMRQELLAELLVARDVASDLRRILDHNSRWEVQVYLANLGSTPFLVQTHARLEVRDETGASFSEDCFLVLRRAGED